jgi:hypothetical protein
MVFAADPSDQSESRSHQEDNWRVVGATYVTQVSFIWEVLSEGIGKINQGCTTTFALGVQVCFAAVICVCAHYISILFLGSACVFAART